MPTGEAPEVTEAIEDLLLLYGNELWFLDARQVIDNAGARLEVLVLNEHYIEDVLPRKLGNCFLVVRKVDSLLHYEKSIRQLVGKA